MKGKVDIPAGYVTGVLGASGGYDEGHLIAADDHRRFCGIATFLKAPLLDTVTIRRSASSAFRSTAAARAPPAHASGRAACARRAFA